MREYEFDHTKQLGPDDDFRVAAAITAFDSNYTVTEDPTVGEIKFVLKSWSLTEPITFTYLKDRPCNDADFEGEDAFWPLHPKYAAFRDYRKKMKCIDEPYQIWGDYNAEITQNLLVVFESCNRTVPGNNCKSEAEA